ncbi:DUF2244 domain-containing protein [Rhodosalinus sp.]|uniref:DUF2244 domain-containing protein n=1 Tax=Rhodosalinus sp. TaxID=2047741 RepID=UPI003561F850
MPYSWTENADPQAGAELRLWPHRSLPLPGFAAVILGMFAFACLPMLAVIGTAVLWGVLPFALIAVGGLWIALRRSYRDGEILEELRLTEEAIRLTRRDPKGAVQEWQSNPYWTRVELHEQGGPVPYYVTLRGSGRQVEIGAFLSEDERKALYGDLRARLSAAARL